MNFWKRVSVLMAALALLCSLLTAAHAEQKACPACGRMNAEDAKFCDQCGSPLQDDAEPEDPAAAAGDPAVGDILTFGTYPQTAMGNDNSLIEWIVLDIDEEGNRALLISRYGLDCQEYDWRNRKVTWESCTLRWWLNGSFLEAAFSETEQKIILTTTVDNSASQGNSSWSTGGGKNTKDKVFLLSCAEANLYFGVTEQNMGNVEARVKMTKYASAQGASPSVTMLTADGSGAGWWWLRSPGFSQNCAASVSNAGSLSGCNVDSPSGCVRPAMWVSLGSGKFDGWTCTEDGQVNHGETCLQCGKIKARVGYEVGSTLTFGTCPQTSGGKDKTAIEWIVLDRDGTNALVISKYGLDTQPYNKADKEVTWEACTLRKWLNSTFMNKAFTADEKKAILKTMVDNGDSGNTQDNVFLLSYAEAEKYFSSDEDRKCAPTEYAARQGAACATRIVTADGKPAGWWWLRSPGQTGEIPYVDANGSLDNTMGCSGYSGSVRPVLWIDLSAGGF